jgi:hypothetical protein
MSLPSGYEGLPVEALIRMLIDGIKSLQDCRYTSAAAVTIYVYDVFLTFDAEVRAGFQLADQRNSTDAARSEPAGGTHLVEFPSHDS